MSKDDEAKRPDYYEFAGVRFLPANGVIVVIQTNHKISLSKIHRDFLLALVEKAGAVVTYKELRLKVWPHETEMDERLKHTIQVTKGQLINLLKRRGVKADFVEAVDKKGYRLSVKVKEIKTETPGLGHEIGANGTKEPPPITTPSAESVEEERRETKERLTTDEPTTREKEVSESRPPRPSSAATIFRNKRGVALSLVVVLTVTLVVIYFAQTFGGPCTVNEEAYQEYLKGRSFWSKRTAPDFWTSIKYFEKARKLKPDCALFHAGIADSYLLLGVHMAVSPDKAFPEARKAANKALELDNNLADAHATMAAIKLFADWNWEGADQEFKHAIDLNPNHAYAHQWNGLRLVALKRLDEAVSAMEYAEMEYVKDKDLLPPIISTNVGWVYYMALRYEAALKQLEDTVNREPNFPRVHVRLGMVYELKGRHEDAITEYGKALDRVGEDSYVMGLLGYSYATSGQRDRARADVRTHLLK